MAFFSFQKYTFNFVKNQSIFYVVFPVKLDCGSELSIFVSYTKVHVLKREKINFGLLSCIKKTHILLSIDVF